MISRNLSQTVSEPLHLLNVPVSVSIRVCEANDLGKLEWFGMFTHDRDIIQNTFFSQTMGSGVMLIAEACGFPIGQVWLDYTRREEGIGLIWAFRVIDCYQNLGIGQELLAVAERTLRQAGFHAAELAVEKQNSGAKRLYERSGYSVVDEKSVEHHYVTPDGLPMSSSSEQWLMRKPLLLAS